MPQHIATVIKMLATFFLLFLFKKYFIHMKFFSEKKVQLKLVKKIKTKVCRLNFLFTKHNNIQIYTDFT